MRHRDWSVGTVAAGIVTVAALAVVRRRRWRRRPRRRRRRRADPYDTYRAMAQSSPYRARPWQYLGPTNISGRATDVAVADRGGARRIYAGYATSGVWKTDDDGATWQSIFDNQPSTSIGDIAVAPSNPDIVWVGTGEANLFRASMPGVGIYKSTDGGRTFTHSGLTDTQTIAPHPRPPHQPRDRLRRGVAGTPGPTTRCAACSRPPTAAAPGRRCCYRSPRTGAIDLVMDPADPNTLYAATWQRSRRKWSDPRVEPGYDRGRHLEDHRRRARPGRESSQGLPAPQFRGRIGIDIVAIEPERALRVRRQLRGRPAAARRRARRVRHARSRRAASRRPRSTAATTRGDSWRKVSESNDS